MPRERRRRWLEEPTKSIKGHLTVQVKQNSQVITIDGQEIGQVSRVVIDPLLREVTHLVIREKEIPAAEKLIPIDLVAQGPDRADQIRVRCKATELELRPFEETHYVPLTKQVAERANIPGIQARPVYFYPPAGEAWEGHPYPPDFPEQPYVAKTEQNIPEEAAIPLQEKASVVSIDGEDVGNVEQFIVDPASGRITYYLISAGRMLANRKLVPVSWTTTLTEDQVELKVSSDLLKSLPPYQDLASNISKES
jgi:sporulation protein YlmC with PRC-barrel domain